MADIVGYLNGDWVSRSEIKISATDRGFKTSDVVFDVARTFNGKIFKKDVHLDRLYRSLKYVRIDPGLSKDEMGGLLEEGVRRNEEALSEVGDFYIWPLRHEGPGPLGVHGRASHRRDRLHTARLHPVLPLLRRGCARRHRQDPKLLRPVGRSQDKARRADELQPGGA